MGWKNINRLDVYSTGLAAIGAMAVALFLNSYNAENARGQRVHDAFRAPIVSAQKVENRGETIYFSNRSKGCSLDNVLVGYIMLKGELNRGLLVIDDCYRNPNNSVAMQIGKNSPYFSSLRNSLPEVVAQAEKRQRR